MVPPSGLEPELLSEPHFECGASTNSAKGASTNHGDRPIFCAGRGSSRLAMKALKLIDWIACNPAGFGQIPASSKTARNGDGMRMNALIRTLPDSGIKQRHDCHDSV
jgi:hypothetical protein